MNNNKIFAVFSAKQKEWVGSSIYRRPDGSEVEITSVSSEEGCPETKWSDKVSVGEVVAWVRTEKHVPRDEIKIEYHRQQPPAFRK